MSSLFFSSLSSLSSLSLSSTNKLDQKSKSTPNLNEQQQKKNEKYDENENENNNKEQSMFDLSQFRNGENNSIYLKHSWATVSEPDMEQVYVRSKYYMDNSKKIKSENILFPLVAVECYRTPNRIDHLAQSKYLNWYKNHIDPNDDNIFVLIIQLQVQSLNSTFVHYHVWENGLPIKTESESFNQLFSQILKGDDDFCNARLKLIPRIVSGPFAVQAMVKNTPVLLGTKVKHRYFRGRNYFEIDSEVDESYISAGILKLCHRLSRSIVVDMCWVIEGQNEIELPERVMCGISIHNMDFSRIIDIPVVDDEEKLSWKIKKMQYYEQKDNSDSNSNENDITNNDNSNSDSNNNNNNNTNNITELNHNHENSTLYSSNSSNSSNPYDANENSTTVETDEYNGNNTLTDYETTEETEEKE